MQSLIHDYGIEAKKIIPFSVYAKSEIIENIIAAAEEPDGIILGNSHAYLGYLPEYLEDKFINMSCPSQGIYHNCKAFQRYMNCYQNLIQKLKYVVFDLYDYNIFNSDISLTRGLFDYISWGVIEKYHYDDNIHYHVSFEKELFNNKCMIAQLGLDEETA